MVSLLLLAIGWGRYYDSVLDMGQQRLRDTLIDKANKKG